MREGRYETGKEENPILGFVIEVIAMRNRVLIPVGSSNKYKETDRRPELFTQRLA